LEHFSGLLPDFSSHRGDLKVGEGIEGVPVVLGGFQHLPELVFRLQAQKARGDRILDDIANTDHGKNTEFERLYLCQVSALSCRECVILMRPHL